MSALPPLTPDQLRANEAKSARSPLGEGAHYVDRTDERGRFRVLCRCGIGTAHDEAGVPAPLRWPDSEYGEGWRWAPVLGVGAVPLTSLESTIGARDE